MLSAAPLLVAAVCSFAGPSGHLAAPLARPLAAAAVPTVYMAGWNDPFSSAGGSNREKMEVKQNHYDCRCVPSSTHLASP